MTNMRTLATTKDGTSHGAHLLKVLGCRRMGSAGAGNGETLRDAGGGGTMWPPRGGGASTLTSTLPEEYGFPFLIVRLMKKSKL